LEQNFLEVKRKGGMEEKYRKKEGEQEFQGKKKVYDTMTAAERKTGGDQPHMWLVFHQSRAGNYTVMRIFRAICPG
jgi:hypothetical protein